MLQAFILLLIQCIFTSLDARFNRTFLTPYAVMSWPYVAICFSVNTVGRFLEYYEINTFSISIQALGFLCFFLGSNLPVFALRKYTRSPRGVYGSNRFFWICVIIFSIVALWSLSKVYTLINTDSLFSLNNKEESNEFGAGPLAHLIIFAQVISIYLYWFIQKKGFKYKGLLSWVPIVVLILILFLNQIKGSLYLYALTLFYFLILGGFVKFNFIRLAGGVVLGVLFFFSIYLFKYDGSGSAFETQYLVFIARHFADYLFAGPISLSVCIYNSNYPYYSFEEVFAVPLNFYYALSGKSEYVNVLMKDFQQISPSNASIDTNVYTMIGQVYIYIGMIGMAIYIFFLGLFCGAVNYLSKLSDSPFLQQLQAFLLGTLSLSFFSLFFNLLKVYEIVSYLLILHISYKLAVTSNARSLGT